MSDYEYCEAWPDELKELSRQRYRALHRVRCLEAAITRIDPSQFDALMEQVEHAQREVSRIRTHYLRMKWEYENRQMDAALHAGGWSND